MWPREFGVEWDVRSFEDFKDEIPSGRQFLFVLCQVPQGDRFSVIRSDSLLGEEWFVLVSEKQKPVLGRRVDVVERSERFEFDGRFLVFDVFALFFRRF